MSPYFIFSIVILVGQFSPGPDFLLLLKNALNHGRRAARISALGVALGLAIHTSIAIGGLAVLFTATSTTGKTLRYLGAAYLLYLAVRLLFAKTHRESAQPSGGASPISTPLGDRAAFTQGLLTNLLNPKLIIFLSSILAQFLTPDSPPTAKWIYATLIVGQGLLFWLLFVELLHLAPVRRAFLRHQRPFNRLFATLLTIIALRTLTS